MSKSTVADMCKKFAISGLSVREYCDGFMPARTILSKDEEKAVEVYCLWQCDRGIPLNNKQVKAIIRAIHCKAVAEGQSRQPINIVSGPSSRYMKRFYTRHPLLKRRQAEFVDRGRINMASQDVINQYFDLLKETLLKTGIAKADGDGNIIQDSIKSECVYLADETGWGVKSKTSTVIGRSGAKHVHRRKISDESHKTLMLGVCGNGDVLKSLIILEKSFPLVGEGESEFLPSNILLSKTDKGSMEKKLFCEWLEKCVLAHKCEANPSGTSLLIVDNHGSRFDLESIDLCRNNDLEILCYPGHLTHILQGPDVVLNKPISTIVDDMLDSTIFIRGNNDVSRIAFINIIEHAVKEVCTPENVAKAFSATGVIPFNPNKVNLSQFATSSSSVCPESPVKAVCSQCRVNNVELHPLVKQGVVPKRLAEIFTYTPPPKKSRSRSKVVKHARIVTSDDVVAEIKAVEQRKMEKCRKKKPIIVEPDSEDSDNGDGDSSELSSNDSDNDDGDSSELSSNDSDNGESSDESSVRDAAQAVESSHDNDMPKYTQGEYVIVKYTARKSSLYYIGVISEIQRLSTEVCQSLNASQNFMYNVVFFKKVMINNRECFILNPSDVDDIVEDLVFAKLDTPSFFAKKDEIYYNFKYDEYAIELGVNIPNN